MRPEDLESEWKAWQRGNRRSAERSLRVHGLPEDLFDLLDPQAPLFLGPRDEDDRGDR
jgi:hypothetical protein